MNKSAFTLQLEWTKMLTPEVKHFAFSRVDQPALDFIPGQFITIWIPYENTQLKRSYSIATMPNQSSYIELAASYVPGGYASEFLFQLNKGDIVTGTGPLGRLILSNQAYKRLIFVATSTGITPYRSMLPQLIEKAKAGVNVVVILGVRSRQNGLYFDDFLPIQQQYPNFEFIVHYSRDLPLDHQPYEYRGYVQDSLKKMQPLSEQDKVYLCGNPEMVDQAYQWLKHNNLPNQNIVREKYVSPITRAAATAS